MDDTAELNKAVFETLVTPSMRKQAMDAVNDFTRMKMREDGFYQRINPPLKISDDELDRSVPTNLYLSDLERLNELPPAYRDMVRRIRFELQFWDAKHGGELIALAEEWARSKDYPVAVIVDGDAVLFLLGECEPVTLRRPRGIEL